MRNRPVYVLISALTLIALTYLLVNHVRYASKFTNLAVLHALLFVHFAIKVIASLAAKPHVPLQGVDLSRLKVDVVMPIFNEDPALLAAAVHGLARQIRRPHTVWLIDDGSHRDGEPILVLKDPLVVAAIAAARTAGIFVITHRQSNAGKRWAQSYAFKHSDADVFITNDSDTVLEADAIEKLIIPFGRTEVQAVGGLACGQNYRQNLLTRATDLGFTMAFIQGRTAEGFFGSVRVNCGIFAGYRGDVVRDNLDRYLNQQFLGAPVKAGDDRALTFFAKERGRAEFQPGAVAYSALPQKLGHLARQRIRWARSWVWGTLWLLRRPVFSADFAFTITQLVGILAFGVAMTTYTVGTISGAVSADLLTSSILTAIAIGYISHLRYILVAHRNDSIWQRILTWLLSPLATMLYIFLFLPLYYVAMTRPKPQKTWGTRESVEVGLHVTPNMPGGQQELAA